MTVNNPDLKNGFQLVLKHLEAERSSVQHQLGELQRRIRDLDNSIATLYRESGIERAPIPIKLVPPQVLQIAAGQRNDQKYASISVHWAILHLLSESSAMTSAEIADALVRGGVKTRAANFTNNVSAVLSTNMRLAGREEVEQIDGKWRLTDIGRNKISYVVTTPKFLSRCPWAAVPGAVNTGHSSN